MGADYAQLQPSQVLLDNSHLLPASGRALDLACGLGANALYLAKRGMTTSAWDLSPVQLRLYKIELRLMEYYLLRRFVI